MAEVENAVNDEILGKIDVHGRYLGRRKFPLTAFPIYMSGDAWCWCCHDDLWSVISVSLSAMNKL